MYNFTFLNHIIFWFEVLEINHAQKYLQTARTSFEQGTAASQALQAAPRRSSYRQASAIQQGAQEHKEIGISFFFKKKTTFKEQWIKQQKMLVLYIQEKCKVS